jgi:hypothetical protein
MFVVVDVGGSGCRYDSANVIFADEVEVTSLSIDPIINILLKGWIHRGGNNSLGRYFERSGGRCHCR